nr:hypothetical protein [Tanacetum cinerariifolium]
MIRLRDEAASTSYSPPLQLPSASRREDRPEGQITALQGQVIALQTQVATLQGQQGQQRLARDPTQPEPPEEAGGS